MEGAVIDRGGDLPRLQAEATRLGVQLTQILLTHAHIDHAGGTGTLARTLGLPIIGPHPGDQFWIDGLAQQARMFGFAPAEPFTPTRWLGAGTTPTSAAHEAALVTDHRLARGRRHARVYGTTQTDGRAFYVRINGDPQFVNGRFTGHRGVASDAGRRPPGR